MMGICKHGNPNVSCEDCARERLNKAYEDICKDCIPEGHVVVVARDLDFLFEFIPINIANSYNLTKHYFAMKRLRSAVKATQQEKP